MTTSTPPVGTAVGAVDFGARFAAPRTRAFSFRVRVRALIVGLTLLVATTVVVVLSLTTGTYEIPIADVLAALLGDAHRSVQLVVSEWRLPRALLAALLGAALGVSGAVFQSITRNPLGSPDIIGFSAGSYTGALVVMLLFGGGYLQTAFGALVGGMLTAVLVFALAYRRGVQGFRLIIVGIGVSAMLASVNTYLMLRASTEDMMRAGVWGAGSLNGLSTATLVTVTCILAVLVPLALTLAPRLSVLELGDDAAGSVGLHATRTRLVAMLLGVALIALVTAAAGPIAFIALVAPQIARRATGTTSVGLPGAAVTGAFLLTLSDFIGQRLFAPVQLPVGVVTVSVGGVYFIWLLVREGRRR